MSTLTVLSEDYNILPYLNRNGLYPTRVDYYTADVMEAASFCDEDTLFLIIIHSLTRFTTAELRHLLDQMKTALMQGASVYVLSDIDLAMPELFEPGIEYIVYSGDLFFGTYRWVNIKGKVLKDTVKEDQIAESSKKPNPVCALRQGFWNQFAEFTDPNVQTEVSDIVERGVEYTTSDDRFMSQILNVELFNN